MPRRIHTETVETTYQASGNHVKFLRQILKNQEEFMKNQKGVQNGMNKGNSIIKKGVKILKGYAAALISIKAAKKAIELGKLGATALTVNKNFDKFAKDSGRSTSAMMDQLRDASQGMIDDMALQQQALQAMIGGVDFDDVVTSLEFVRNFSVATGKDITQKFQSVMTGLARGSAAFLDDVGIQVMGSKDVVNDAVEQMRQKMGDFADTSGDSSTKIARLKTSVKQLGIEFGKMLAPAIGRAAEKLTSLVNLLTEAQKGFRIEGLENTKKKIDSLEASIENLSKTRDEHLEKFNNTNKELYKKYADGTQRIIDKQSKKLKDYKNEYETNLEEIYGVVVDHEDRVKAKEIDSEKERSNILKMLTDAKITEESKAVDEVKKKWGDALKNEKLTAKERKEVQAQMTKELRAIRAKYHKDDIKLEEEAVKERKRILEEVRVLQLDKNQKEIDAEEKKWDKYLENTELSETEANNIRAQKSIEITKIRIKHREEERAALKEILNNRISEEADIQKEADDKRLKDEEDLQNALFKLAQSTSDSIFGIMSSIQASRINDIRKTTQAEIEAVEKSKKSEKDKAKEIDRIKTESAKKELKLRLKQWKADLWASISNTALGVTKALASAEWPINLINAATVGAIGAKNIATIASNKPKFRTGSVDAAGKPRKIPRSFGSPGGVDSQLGQFTDGEVIIPPGEMADKALAAVNGDTNNSQSITISAPINITGGADMNAVKMIPEMLEQSFARFLENQSKTNIANRWLT